MNTPNEIRVTAYRVGVPFPGHKTPVSRLRYRWRAELVVNGGCACMAEGHEAPDAAIGAVIRAAARECESPDDVLDLVAGLFGDLDQHPADVQLGRAIRLAARNPRRRHPGCVVTIADPVTAAPVPVPAPARIAKGGAL